MVSGHERRGRVDPDANLDEQLSLAESILERIDSANEDGTISPDDMGEIVEDAQRLAELVQELQSWVSRGGFLPAAWKR